MRIKKIDAVFGIILVLTAVFSMISVKSESVKTETASIREYARPVKVEPPLEAAVPVKQPELYDVPLDEDLQLYIISLCKEKNIEPNIVLAIIDYESDYKADATGDSGNSCGLMQVQPRWHYGRMSDLGCTDLYDPYQNITVGVDYLEELISLHNGSVEKALVAYNQGSYNGNVTEYAVNVLNIAKGI